MNSGRPAAPSVPAASGGDALPRPGEIVAGKYRIDSVLGVGGMGVVLGAEDTSLGRHVAIKFLAPGRARTEDAVARFLREARAAASLQSEHVVRVFEVGSLPNGASFIVMERLAGRDLGQLLEARGPLPVEEAVDYVMEACEAIAEAHGKGIVHRDLKPQNLFVATLPDGSPSVKVLDFGISKAIEAGAVNLTATGAVMGTPLYMSPEQVRSLKSVDLRSDIWSLGAILFELLTASPIFDAASATALCAMIAMDPPTPLRAKRSEAPAELEAVLLRCLHKDPAGRFPDVAALTEALAPFATERGRLSASRVARVVRGGSPSGGGVSAPPGTAGASGANVQSPLAYAPTGGASLSASSSGGFWPTGGFGSLPPGPIASGAPPTPTLPPGPPGPPSPPAAAGASNYPPGAVPVAIAPSHQPMLAPAGRSTSDGWQQPTGSAMHHGPAPSGRSSSLLFAIVGAGAAFAVLAIVVVGAVLWLSQRRSADASKGDADAAATPAAAAPAVPSVSPALAASAPPPSASVAANPATKKAAAKDAGAPPSPGSARPANPDDDPARIARLRQIAQGRCSLQQGELSRNDASNNSARTVKLQACLAAQSLSPNSGSSQCERQTCRSACTILNDQQCLQQLDFAERNNPLKF